MIKFLEKCKLMLELVSFKSEDSFTHTSYFMTLTSNVDLLNPAFIDSIILSKISYEQHLLLHQVILKHIMHNYRGHLSPFADSMIDNICSERFPKEFVDETRQYEAEMCVTHRCDVLLLVVRLLRRPTECPKFLQSLEQLITFG